MQVSQVPQVLSKNLSPDRAALWAGTAGHTTDTTLDAVARGSIAYGARHGDLKRIRLVALSTILTFQ